MRTRLAAVPSLEDRRQVGPVHRSIIVLDLEDSTKRSNPAKGEVRRVLYDLLGRALAAVAVTGNRLEQMIDRGDGVLVLVRPHDDVPKTVLLERMIPLLATLLAAHNARAAQPSVRMRLRVVLHAGEVHADERGWYGEAIDVAVRLLDAPPVKQALKQASAPLVLVVSDEIYSGIVVHGYVDAGSYSSMGWVRVAGRRHRGWVHVPAREWPGLLPPSPWLLGRQRPGVAEAGLDPPGQVVVAGDVVGGDAEPAGHLAALHHRGGGGGGGDQVVGPGGVDVDEHPALAAGADRHVAADQEREAAEHPLLGQLRVGADQVPDAPGEHFVVGHGEIVPSRSDNGTEWLPCVIGRVPPGRDHGACARSKNPF
jgi:hypothetical protein